MGLCLAIGTLAAFWPVRDCQFTNLDDLAYVRNRHVQEGLSTAGVSWALTATENDNWHPLTWLSLQFDYQLYRLGPGGYHVTNLLLHTANALLLFWVMRRLTGAALPSALVATLFAVHPLHVESVAWVAERKDVLSTLFWMLTLWAYVRYAERPGIWRYGCVVLALALGLTAKPMLVTMPFVLLLLDYWPLRRLAPAGPYSLGSLVAEKLPLLTLAAASCVITLAAQQRAIRAAGEIPLACRGANAAVSYARYLGQMIWPHDLVVLYPYVRRAWSDWWVLGACLLLAGISIVAVLQAARRPFLLVGWLWYLGTLVPVIGLVQVGGQAHADRYTYVPLIGVFTAIAWTAAELARRPGPRRWLVAAGATGALFGFALLSRAQLAHWHDSVALWSHTLAVIGPQPDAQFSLGAAYRAAGQPERAVEEFRRVLALEPRYGDARVNLAWCLLLLGRVEEADDEFVQILPINPADADAHFELGVQASQSNQPNRAIVHFTRVLRLRPGDAAAYLNLALEMIKLGHYEAARWYLGEAARHDPQLRDTPAFRDALRASDEGHARRNGSGG